MFLGFGLRIKSGLLRQWKIKKLLKALKFNSRKKQTG
jgi:hypothetical protein